jgi:hypothetical protein
MNRRQFIQHFMGLATGMAGIPHLALSTNRTRRFLFVFCDGAWDTSMVFAPEMLDNRSVYTDSNDTTATLGGLSFVDSPNRPEVRRFFEQWGSDCLIINGMDFETVAHDRAKRILLTGSATGMDDWGAIIGAQSPKLYTAPHLLLSGPNYSTNYANALLRIGENGELKSLMDGIENNNISPNTSHESLVNAYLQQRSQNGDVQSQANASFNADFRRAHQQLAAFKAEQSRFELPGSLEMDTTYGFDCNETFMGQAQLALDFFAQDLSRCAIVQDEGFCNMRWDSHGDYFEQNWHYDLLFLGLQQLMTELQSRTGIHGTPLIEETTVVVCSEMSRHPQLNEMGGKHHWPVGSAMIIGGVTGGRTIGGYTDQVLGVNIDPQSAEGTDFGEKLRPGHLGATLLAMADIDPAEFLLQSPISGVLL